MEVLITSVQLKRDPVVFKARQKAIFLVDCAPDRFPFVSRERLNIINQVDDNVVVLVELVIALFLFDTPFLVILRARKVQLLFRNRLQTKVAEKRVTCEGP